MTSACRKNIIKLPNRKGGALVTVNKPVSLRHSRSGSKTFWLTTMMLPATIWLLLIRYLPMFGIMMSFLDYKLPTRKVPFPLNLLESPWVGLKNFQFLFTSESLTMIRNTIGYNALWIVLGLLISVSFAIMMSELTRKFLAKTYQTMMFFPYFLSWVVVSYFLFAFLDPTNGMIVRAQRAAGVNVIDWYNSPGYWPYILTICSMWKNTGYSTVLYLSAITGIDRSQYEAAAVDGATKWQQMIHITLPHLKPMIIILLIMNIGKIFNADFGLFWSVPMNSAPLFPVTQVVDTYVYRAYTSTGNVGMSTAAGFLQNLVGFICIMIANGVVRRLDADSSLF
ncbi:MAG: sugar ABC transporter permease [Clostridia bacterium]|nr:sugar ABC transporter permease [Clostridia bacterium]